MLIWDEHASTKLSSGISSPTRGSESGSGGGSSSSSSSTKLYQRPFGCGVVDLSRVRIKDRGVGVEVDLDTMPLFRPSKDVERHFPRLHEAIIFAEEHEYEHVPFSQGVALSLALVEGNLNRALEAPGPSVGHDAKKGDRVLSREFVAHSDDLRRRLGDVLKRRLYTCKLMQHDITDPRDQREEVFVRLMQASELVSQW